MPVAQDRDKKGMLKKLRFGNFGRMKIQKSMIFSVGAAFFEAKQPISAWGEVSFQVTPRVSLSELAEVYFPWDMGMLLFSELYAIGVPIFVPDRRWIVSIIKRNFGEDEEWFSFLSPMFLGAFLVVFNAFPAAFGVFPISKGPLYCYTGGVCVSGFGNELVMLFSFSCLVRRPEPWGGLT